MARIQSYAPQIVANERFNSPRADGTSFGAQIGQQVAGLGDAIGAAARIYQEDQTRLARFKAMTQTEELTQAETQRLMQDRQNSMTPGGQDFTKNFMKKHNEQSEKFIGTLPRELQDEFRLRLTRIRGGFAETALKTELGERNRYYNEEIDKTNNQTLNRIDAAPQNKQQYVDEAIAKIQASGLSPADKATKIQSLKELADEAHWRRLAADDPEAAAAAVGRGRPLRDPTKAAVAARISELAKEHGVDPQLVLMIAHAESGLNPAARNEKTGFTGVFQFHPKTAARYGLEHHSSADEFLRGGVKHTKDNILAAKAKLGRDPKPWEVYLYHWQGKGGGDALLSADPNASVVDVLNTVRPGYGKLVAEANPAVRGTVADFLEHVKGKSARSMLAVGGSLSPEDAGRSVAPEFANIPYARRIQLAAQAINDAEKKERAEYTVENRRSQDVAEETYKKGLDLIRQNGLTEDWLAAHREKLNSGMYKEFSEAIRNPPTVRSNSDVLTDLLTKSRTDPDEAEKGAVSALATKKLSQADFKTVLDRVDQTRRRDESDERRRPPWYTAVRGSIENELKPSEFDLDRTQSRIQQNALLDFENWVWDSGKAATFEEARKRKEAIVDGAREAHTTQTLELMTPPRFLGVPPKNATVDDINKAIEATRRAREQRKITEEEARKEAGNLRGLLGIVNGRKQQPR